MTKLFTLIWKLWFGVVALVVSVFCAPLVLLLSYLPGTHYIMHRLAWIWASLLLYLSGIWPRVIGENPPLRKDKNYIIISNHTSIIDIPVMLYLHPFHPMSFVGKKEVNNIPLIGQVFKRIMIAVDRQDPHSRRQVYVQSAKKIEQGYSLCIYPEGGVPDDMNMHLGKFKDGAFKMSIQHKIPVLVYAVDNLKEIFPFDLWKGRPGFVRIKFLKELSPAEDIETMKNQAYHLISDQLKSIEK